MLFYRVETMTDNLHLLLDFSFFIFRRSWCLFHLKLKKVMWQSGIYVRYVRNTFCRFTSEVPQMTGKWKPSVEVTTKPVFRFSLGWRFILSWTKIISLKKYAPHSAPHQKTSPHSHKIVFWVRKSSPRVKIFVKRENLLQENNTAFGISCDLDNTWCCCVV